MWEVASFQFEKNLIGRANPELQQKRNFEVFNPVTTTIGVHYGMEVRRPRVQDWVRQGS